MKSLMLFVPVLALVAMGVLFFFECRGWAQEVVGAEPAGRLFEKHPNEPEEEDSGDE